MDYAAVAKKAAASIAKNGRLVYLRRTMRTGGDPATGDPGTETVTDYPVMAVEEELTMAELSSMTRNLGSDVVMNDKRLMVAAVQTTGAALPAPTAADKIVDGTKVYNIAYAPRPLAPGSTALYWTIQVRGA